MKKHSKTRTPHLEMLASLVAEQYGVTVEDIFGRRRFKTIAAARHRLITMLRLEERSYPEIGRMLGLDHTTVMAAVKKELARSEAYVPTTGIRVAS